MYSYSICRCRAYGYVQPMLGSLFFHADPKKGSPGSSSSSPVCRDPVTQDVAAQSAAVATRCCVMNLPCDPARRGRKDRFAYSLTVVHFRKVVNRQKIGSPENSRPVILFRFYKLSCNFILLKLHHEKDWRVTNCVITVCVLRIENMHQ